MASPFNLEPKKRGHGGDDQGQGSSDDDVAETTVLQEDWLTPYGEQDYTATPVFHVAKVFNSVLQAQFPFLRKYIFAARGVAGPPAGAPRANYSKGGTFYGTRVGFIELQAGAWRTAMIKDLVDHVPDARIAWQPPGAANGMRGGTGKQGGNWCQYLPISTAGMATAKKKLAIVNKAVDEWAAGCMGAAAAAVHRPKKSKRPPGAPCPAAVSAPHMALMFGLLDGVVPAPTDGHPQEETIKVHKGGVAGVVARAAKAAEDEATAAGASAAHP
eukprot:g4887.t1